MKRTELNGLFDYSGTGGELPTAYGALIGGGLTAGAMLATKAFTRKSSNWSKYAGAVGIAVGGVPAVAMLFFPKTQRAGYLALAVSAIAGLTELIKDVWIEPKQLAGLGLYQPEMTGAGEEISILGDEYVDGAAPIEILGQSTVQQALGAYQTEMTGANPLDVMGANGGYSPFSGAF